jgi:SAM-dependent methyltransferase
MSSQLYQTRDAFDSVAADYDGPRGNNSLVQDMREEMWRLLDATFAPGTRLLDLGCGTGLDAVRLARAGHDIVATDWSPRMVERTSQRAEREQLKDRVQTLTVGSHELFRIEGCQQFDGAYSNLGALNCVPDLASVAAECRRLLKSDGRLVFAVIGRVCPWEIGYYTVKRNWARLKVRFAREMVPVGMNKRVVWTRYYTPGQFYAPFRQYFSLLECRALCLFAPPPYLTWVKERHRAWYERLWRIDRYAGGWPLLRSMGDHFVIVMQRR